MEDRNKVSEGNRPEPLQGGAACPPIPMRLQSNWGEPSPEAEFEIPHLVRAPSVPASFRVCPGGSGSWPTRHWVPGRSQLSRWCLVGSGSQKFQLQNHTEFTELHSFERLPSNIFKRKSFVCTLIIKLRLTDF